ncbi:MULTISPECIES: 50S ribosomal protein L25/general stress protein Ctc [unclassified Frigoribacterium]|jgi:large subunit ribosomal protein L25|uniref:50S ribosomal protein L25/general stress protein Ctc n=1 Tax=unclassified Frigoribacterium TaxID=2627005 RepID=UPI0017863452|nr:MULTISPECIES: 50S ribosomal protein L25/general stress protein Ctc [unclassified Frigoribacterium]MBD8583737.1 50S ribosomal protein L25/general stress protein Ctc [Frigoribacterium sp. CFBP 8766]MBF4580044.1 50S ribosomal protein L25/general stress protein Ctc [Frigoribacterium sp. VKM Ac-2530]
MADDNTLSALVRTSFGKGAARKIRAKDQIPAVIYGHGTDPQHVTLPGHETMLITRRSNALITLDIEGTKQLALVKDIQRDPVKQVIEHIDLIVVRQGEKVEVDVPVHIEGESAPGTIHVVELNAITLEVSATAIPQSVVVSIEGLEDGAQVHASDVVLPEGASLVTDAEVLITSVSVPQLDLTTDAVDDESGEAAEAEGDVPSIEDEERSE